VVKHTVYDVIDTITRCILGGGSMVTGTMDEYSDLDLIVVYQSAYQEEIMNQRLNIVEELGSLLAVFTGEHVGEPQLVICLYGPSPLHVDFKFVTPKELEERIEDPLVLWEREMEDQHDTSENIALPPLP
jgi:hypothetical protein